jgi:hypothetical protein
LANEEAPLVKTLTADVDAVAAGADGTVNIGRAPFDGTITAVNYVPNATLTGANTDSRTLSIINKGQSGSGTTSVASKAFTSGVNAPASDETPLTLSGTAANLNVVQGDILAFVSTHVGSTGLADPGGLVEIDITRTNA